MLMPMPEAAIGAALRKAGKGEIAELLGGDLIVDAARLRQTGWQPAEATADALASAMRERAAAADTDRTRH